MKSASEGGPSRGRAVAKSPVNATSPSICTVLTAPLERLDVLSLEAWDQVWRRNQHFIAGIAAEGSARRIVMHAPAAKLSHVPRSRPLPRVEVRTPHLLLPPGKGGRAVIGWELRRSTRAADLLWINDPIAGVRCLRRGRPAVYDVTDDWRHAELRAADRSLLVEAEDVLARQAGTIVCSEVLADRWQERYGFRPPVVQNGVDLEAHAGAVPIVFPDPGPHIVYVGTLHHERLDIGLLERLTRDLPQALVDLVGPDSLSVSAKDRLLATGRVRLHGPVPHHQVPGVMAAADVLICPHVVSPFTLSLDAIKSWEYLASGRPVVATPSSGFQHLEGTPGLSLATARTFSDAVSSALERRHGHWPGRAVEASWSRRSSDFFRALREQARA